MASLAEQIRNETNRALDSNKLSDLIYGIVKKAEPLLVEIDSRFEITDDFIRLSPTLHEIKLKENDILTMVRYQKGQLYYVIEVNGNVGEGGVKDYNLLTNIPTLNTANNNYMNPVPHESIRGTVNLHRISKTGSYNDLNSKPPLRLYQIPRGVGKHRWVKITEMFKDIGYGKNNFYATIHSTSDYGNNKTGMDIVQMGTRGGISVLITRLSYNNVVDNQNKYYYKINGNRVELWILLPRYSYVQELNIHSVEDASFGILETVEVEPQGLTRVLTDNFITESKIKDRYPRYDILENNAAQLKNEENRKFYALPYYPVGAIYLSLNSENPSRYFRRYMAVDSSGKNINRCRPKR